MDFSGRVCLTDDEWRTLSESKFYTDAKNKGGKWNVESRNRLGVDSLLKKGLVVREKADDFPIITDDGNRVLKDKGGAGRPRMRTGELR
jgi:hypothetical protein